VRVALRAAASADQHGTVRDAKSPLLYGVVNPLENSSHRSLDVTIHDGDLERAGGVD